MKKVICIPDSFKGTMSSATVGRIMKSQIEKHMPDAEVIQIEVADGGEGSVDAFLSAVGGKKLFLETKGPYFQPIQSFYGILDNQVAVIEMAASAGLPLVHEMKNPLLTTTYGVGELILDAAKQGCKKIIVGLGGSATNDGGCGAAAAVGIEFFDQDNRSFIPTGTTLKDIVRVTAENKASELNDVEFVVMCDIDNPLYGEQGAAYVFGPQKGASEADVKVLDAGLRHLSEIIHNQLGVDVSHIPGTGAAGGMGAGMIAFFRGSLEMGIASILNVIEFDAMCSDADLIFTGEGKIDAQTLRGKVAVGVGECAKKYAIPVIAVVGAIEENIEAIYEHGITAVVSINQSPQAFEIAKQHSEANLAKTMDNVMRILSVRISHN